MDDCHDRVPRIFEASRLRAVGALVSLGLVLMYLQSCGAPPRLDRADKGSPKVPPKPSQPARPAGQAPSVVALPTATPDEMPKPPAPQPATFHMRINCGSQNAADFSGVNWLADTHATGGDLYSVADAPITDASLEGLYRDFRFGDTFTYSIPVPSQGRYKVSLHLAELFHDVPGKRGFSVSHEGLSLFGEIDMLARGVRKYEPLVLQADVEVGGLELKLEFTKSQDKANCMALEVVKI